MKDDRTRVRDDHLAGTAAAAAARPRHVRCVATRWTAVLSGCAAAWAMTACGGGGYIDSAGNFNIGVTLAGQAPAYTPVASGGSLNVAVQAGQSATFDAGEPAVWTLYVGGAAVSGGAQVRYAGVDIRATTVSRSGLAVETYAAYQLPASVLVTLVATSTYDSAQVATVDLLITN